MRDVSSVHRRQMTMAESTSTVGASSLTRSAKLFTFLSTSLLITPLKSLIREVPKLYFYYGCVCCLQHFCSCRVVVLPAPPSITSRA